MFRFITLLLLVSALGLAPAAAYSVLTHQANVDSCWKPCLVPALQRRYPDITAEELLKAKAFAYGGAIIQDMGYYPLGAALFTNLTHYVRSGDFVRNLLDEAHDRNEYAFALGALAHYAADLQGHSEGTNRALPLVYPELKAKFGNVITYEEGPKQHNQLEFSFDVTQVAAGRYRTEDYHNAIGFEVAKDVLERAFEKTYGLPLGKVFFNTDVSIATFRFAVQRVIPLASRSAWHYQKKEIRKLTPGIKRRAFVYHQDRKEYRRLYGKNYEHPGFGARVLSVFVSVLPKVGPLKPFAFRPPTPEALKIFRASFATVLKTYCGLLSQQGPQAPAPALANQDFDTGSDTHFGEYALADKTYGEWVRKLAREKFADVTPPVRANILTFFASAKETPADKEEQKNDNRKETSQALAELKALPAAGVEK
ncbi:MAG: zinc dependent phospholipase C family protein [Janthinobacterium lividum]